MAAFSTPSIGQVRHIPSQASLRRAASSAVLPPLIWSDRDGEARNQRDNFIKVLIIPVLNEQGEPLHALIFAEGFCWSIQQHCR